MPRNNSKAARERRQAAARDRQSQPHQITIWLVNAEDENDCVFCGFAQGQCELVNTGDHIYTPKSGSDIMEWTSEYPAVDEETRLRNSHHCGDEKCGNLPAVCSALNQGQPPHQVRRRTQSA